jgi:hypothetical protein
MSSVNTQLDAILMRRLRRSLEAGKITAINNCPVDTSSLQESIRVAIDKTDTQIIGQLIAGGVDFSGTTMKSGKPGNYVDYAKDQNDIHQFMEAGGSVIKMVIKSRAL